MVATYGATWHRNNHDMMNVMTDRSEYFKKHNKEYYAQNKSAENERCKEWQRANREKRAAYMRTWTRNAKLSDPGGYARKRRAMRLKAKYGITLEIYDELLSRQGGHCALCDRTPEQERYGVLVVDHCHDTGSVRGLLCDFHNTAIAHVGDNAQSVLRVLKYLQGQSSEQTTQERLDVSTFNIRQRVEA